MSSDGNTEARRKKLGLVFGTIALLWMFGRAARLVELFLDDLAGLHRDATFHLLITRMSQLKPAGFKYPWIWIYGRMFLTVLAVRCGCASGTLIFKRV